MNKKILSVSSEMIKNLHQMDGRLEHIVRSDINVSFEMQSDYFRSLVNAVVYQQLSTRSADSIWKKFNSLVEDLTPENVLSKTDEQLKGAGLSSAKVKYVKAISTAFLENGEVYSNLSNMPDEEVMNHLIKIKGVGEWTAQMFLIFTLGRLDVFPVKDLGIRKAIMQMLGKDNLTTEDYESLRLKWSPLCSVVSLYLWKSVD